MHKVFVGNDTLRTKREAEAVIATLEKRGVRVLRLSDVAFDPTLAKEAVFAQDLFGVDTAIYFDGILDAPTYDGFYSPDLKTSPNTLIIRELAPNKETLDTLKAIGTVSVCALPKKVEKRGNIFALADAYGQRDRKQSWVIYRECVNAGSAPEELHGTLFWMIKSLLAVQTLSKEEAVASGVSAGGYFRYKEWSKKYSKGELEANLRELVRMYHNAHQGKGELESMLEAHLLR